MDRIKRTLNRILREAAGIGNLCMMNWYQCKFCNYYCRQCKWSWDRRVGSEWVQRGTASSTFRHWSTCRVPADCRSCSWPRSGRWRKRHRTCRTTPWVNSWSSRRSRWRCRSCHRGTDTQSAGRTTDTTTDYRTCTFCTRRSTPRTSRTRLDTFRKDNWNNTSDCRGS